MTANVTDMPSYKCVEGFLFYKITGSAFGGPDPDYTRQAVTMIYAYRVAISLLFCGYSIHYML